MRKQSTQSWRIRFGEFGEYLICRTLLQESSSFYRETPHQRSNIPAATVQRNSFVRWPDDDEEEEVEVVVEDNVLKEVSSSSDEVFIGPENRIDKNSPLFLNSFF